MMTMFSIIFSLNILKIFFKIIFLNATYAIESSALDSQQLNLLLAKFEEFRLEQEKKEKKREELEEKILSLEHTVEYANLTIISTRDIAKVILPKTSESKDQVFKNIKTVAMLDMTVPNWEFPLSTDKEIKGFQSQINELYKFILDKTELVAHDTPFRLSYPARSKS